MFSSLARSVLGYGPAIFAEMLREMPRHGPGRRTLYTYWKDVGKGASGPPGGRRECERRVRQAAAIAARRAASAAP